MRNQENEKNLKDQIDWVSTIVPLIFVGAIFILFMLCPSQSQAVLGVVRGFIGDDCGLYYALLGVGILVCSILIGVSKYGKIKLGDIEKPQYSSFKWGTMIFTSTMAADILFYSLCEWALYANEPYIEQLGGIQKWASTFPLFHWGPIAWGFYIILAVAFGFMLHVRKHEAQKFSEACRPLLGNRVDGFWGKMIDLFAIFALLAGTATTFSLATPLLASALSSVFGLPSGSALTIMILLLIAVVYTLTVWFGMKGISRLANICSYLFFTLLIYFLILGGEAGYIFESGFSAVGNMVQNFIGMSTWMDPLRETSFPQNWTIYYWSYWMAWCVATPFFIGSISKGRTVKNVILGGYGWGLAGTFTSFIVLGNYGLAQQMKHGVNISGYIAEGGDISEAILKIFDTLPLSNIGLILLVITMIAFYSTTFDALTMVVSSYSYKKLEVGKEPDKKVRTFWAIMFIVLPIALIFADNSMYQLQSVSLIAAFPIGLIIILIIVSFFKDAKKYLKDKEKK
jgi:choline/carnitine/betaine transport